MLDDIQSPDNLETPPPTPGNASQIKNVRGETSRPPLPIKKNRRLRSKCWMCFGRLEDQKYYVKYKICSEHYKHEPGNCGGTGQFRKHVEEKHPLDWGVDESSGQQKLNPSTGGYWEIRY